ncbi:hypothetical protein B0H13DRAFT_2558664 [Mycena leptocephala]|nr:hypothetical protein B0H13DRAFT_2558664 [Mycena leptocephala]
MRRLVSPTSTQLSTITAQVYIEPTEASQVQQGLAIIRDKLVAALTAEVELANLTPPYKYSLLALRNLIHLKLGLHRAVDVDDGLLGTMATSRPRLQAFELIHLYRVPTPARLTLSGLIPLVAHCTELEKRSLVIDARTVSEVYFERPAGRYVSPMRMFDFAYSPIGQRYQVEAFLFPKLREISYSGDTRNGGL